MRTTFYLAAALGAVLCGTAVVAAQTGNGAPSGSQFNLNILGVSNSKNQNMDGNGNVIFVALGSSDTKATTKILLSPGDFAVLDKNGSFLFSSRRRHTRWPRDWSSDVCSSDLMFMGGGDVPKPREVKGGLLGADYKIENGRYRFARIYNGENWNPEQRAPLTQPGVEVKPGEYLLEVEGREVRPPSEVYSFFENTAGKQIKIKVGPNADGKDAKEVTVVPLPSEFPLRNRAWEEDKRRRVDELSGGKLAYVHVPDTAVGGWLNFNRFYFAQVGKQGAVIDERYNHGGEVADYIIDMLKRPLRNCAISREGEAFCSPLAQIYGPKTMIINEMSGSGGDALPWMFKQDQIGPLVGTRTWGGLVGIYGYPPLLDSGYVTAPRVAIYGLKGDWEVENR